MGYLPMKKQYKTACAAVVSATLLTGCSGSSDVNPFDELFGTICSVTQTVNNSISCIDGALPEVLDQVDEVLTTITDLLDALEGLTQTNPLLADLPIDQITAALNDAIDQATADINERLVGALPEEVTALVDQALVDALSESLIEITDLISPALAGLPNAAETGDPLEVVRAALSAGGNPIDVLTAVTAIRGSLVQLQSGVNTSELVGLVGNLSAASNSAQDAPAQLASALEGLAGTLQAGDPAAIAEALEELTAVAENDLVADLLQAAGGAEGLVNLNPDDLTGLGSNEVIAGISNTIGNVLGLGG